MIDKDDRNNNQLLDIAHRIAVALEKLADHQRDVREDLGAIFQTLNGIEQLVARERPNKKCRWSLCSRILPTKGPALERWKCRECGAGVGPVDEEGALLEMECLQKECTA